MFQVNKSYLKLPGSYLFSTIMKKANAYTEVNMGRTVTRIDIGDATQSIAPAIIRAMYEAVDGMGNTATLHGYVPDLGCVFLREEIAKQDYRARGCEISADETSVSDGAKYDCGNIQEILAADSRIAVCDPVYPVYVDSNVMAGRTGKYDEESGTWGSVIYMPCTAENQFVPESSKEAPDLIYLCTPSNLTGTTLTREQPKIQVDYANRVGAVILYDAAYEAYITEENMPHSICEIEGARACATEFRPYSKSAGFTGVRLGFTVVPKDLKCGDVTVHSLWARHHGTKFNGVPYATQKAVMVVHSQEGKAETKEQVVYYMRNAKAVYDGLKEVGYRVYGVVNSPYTWLKVSEGMTSWDLPDYLLEEANVAGTPGGGFGPSGEGYFRLTGFGTYENTVMAVGRMKVSEK